MDVQTCQSSDLANGRRFTAPLLGGISLEQLVAEDLQETREFQIHEKKKKIYHSAQDCLLSLIEFPRNFPKKKVEQESFECKEEIEDHVSDAQLRTAAALTDVGLLYFCAFQGRTSDVADTT